MIFKEKCNSIDVKSLSPKAFFVFFTIISEVNFYIMLLFIQHKLTPSFLEFSKKYLNENDKELTEWIAKYILSMIDIQFYSEYDYFFVDFCSKYNVHPDLDLPSVEEIKQLVLEQSKEKQEKMFDDMLQEYVFSPMSTKRAQYIIETTQTSIQ